MSDAISRSPRENTRSTISRSTGRISPPSVPWAIIAFISSSVTESCSERLKPMSLTTISVLLDKTHTNGRASLDRKSMGRETIFDTVPEAPRPILLGTSSPNMSVRYVTTTTIRPFAMAGAYGANMPMRSIQSVTYTASISPEKRPVSIPIRVIPICIVERKRSGFSASLSAVRAPELPLLASISRRDLRAETTAISDIEKMPLSNINPSIIRNSIYIFYRP